MYAQDGGSVPLSSSVDVYITVEDVNDNAPEASQPVFYVPVSENSVPDLQIATIQVRHVDSTYYIYLSII